MENGDKYINVNYGNSIGVDDKKELLNYSISQVAVLLGVQESEIRYFTNTFDNILKVEILDKQLIYTEKTIDKLEFLIKLKEKGMTIKEIQQYCREIFMNDEGEMEFKKRTLMSVSDLIEEIIESQNDSSNKLQLELKNQLQETINDSIKKIKDEILEDITKTIENLKKDIIEEQSIQLNQMKNDVLLSIKEIISDNNAEITKGIIESNVTAFKDISESNVNTLKDINSKLESTNNMINLSNENSIISNEKLSNKIDKFIGVMKEIYYIQNDINVGKESTGFFNKLLKGR